MKTLSVVVTKACNMNCTYCLAGEKTSEKMSEEIAEKAVRFIGEYSTQEPFVISFIGGEPLLRFALIEKMVREINELLGPERKYLYNITTNGLLLNETIIHFLLDHRFNITFSIDGYGIGNDVNRKLADGSGSFRKIKDSISLLADLYPAGAVSVRMTVTPQSARYLVYSFNEFRALGYKRFALQIDPDSQWTNEAFDVLEGQLNNIASGYIRDFYTKDRFSLKFIEHKIKIKRNAIKKHSCSAGKNNIAILPDGSIIPCYEMISKADGLVLGTINGEMLSKPFSGIPGGYSGIYGEISRTCSTCQIRNECEAFCSVLCLKDDEKSLESFYNKCEFQKRIINLAAFVGNKLYKKNREAFESYFA